MPLIDLDQANAFETAALPGSGDTNAGAGGLTTSAMANETALEAYGLDSLSEPSDGVSARHAPPEQARHLLPNHAANLADSPIDHPFWTMAAIGAGLFVYKAVTKNEASENVKVSIPSFFAVGLMATAFILAEKWVFGLAQLPSITPTMDFL